MPLTWGDVEAATLEFSDEIALVEIDKNRRGTALRRGDKMNASKAMMPRWFYNLVTDWGWKCSVRKFKASKYLCDMPYYPEDII